MSVASTLWTHLLPGQKRRPRQTPHIYRRILRQARPCWLPLVAIGILSLLSVPLALLLPLPLKVAVDCVLGGRSLPPYLRALLPEGAAGGTVLAAAGIMLLTIGLLMQLQALASWLLQTYTGERLVLELRARLFWHTQRLSLSDHERRGSSDIGYRIQHDAPAIQFITIQGVLPFVNAACTFAALAWVTARIDWKLAIVALFISPALFLLARTSSRQVHDRWHQVKALDSSAMAVLEEVLCSVRLVKAFGREQREHDRFLLRSSERMRGQVKMATIQASFHALIGVLIAIGTASTLVLGALHARSGVITIGELLIVMSYMTQLYEPLRTVSGKIPELQAWRVSLERAFALLDEVPETDEGSGTRPLVRARGHIEFERVSFAYGAHSVLRDVSFRIAPGTRVGILGRTGSGKSTLVNLLTRFYDVQSGCVRLDGVDLRQYRLSDLRDQYSIVLQDPVLFSTTVAENIAFANPEASEEAIIAAAKAADAHEFILRLPDGYRTQVGERGARLSGGQRQRISIARAFLKDAPILICDEPTSSVDARTEHAIMAATEQLMRGRTSFLIAHRLSTLRNCDLLLVLGEGSVRVVTPGELEFEQLLSGARVADFARG